MSAQPQPRARVKTPRMPVAKMCPGKLANGRDCGAGPDMKVSGGFGASDICSRCGHDYGDR